MAGCPALDSDEGPLTGRFGTRRGGSRAAHVRAPEWLYAIGELHVVHLAHREVGHVFGKPGHEVPAVNDVEEPHGVSHLVAEYREKRAALTVGIELVELVRRSGVYFVDRLPPVQLHHGTEDTVVAVSQAYRLIEAMAWMRPVAGGAKRHCYRRASGILTLAPRCWPSPRPRTSEPESSAPGTSGCRANPPGRRPQ